MIRDLLNDIKVQLYERATSPLLISFVIAWCIWNYDFLLILLSGHEPVIKLILIEKSIFPSDWSWVCWRVGGPLASALAYIFLYPFPAQFVYWYTNIQHQKMKKIQQDAEDLTPLTIEESRNIRANVRTLVRKHDEELSEAQSDNERLKSDLKAAEAVRDEISQKLQSAMNDEKNWTDPEKSTSELSLDEDTGLGENEKLETLDPIEKALKELSNLTESQRNEYFLLAKKILIFISDSSGRTSAELSSEIGGKLSDLNYVLEILKSLDYVSDYSSGRYRLNKFGNSYVVENNLHAQLQ